MQLLDAAKKNIEKHCEELGYTILEWGQPSPNEKGYSYHPQVQKVKNGRTGIFIALNVFDNGNVYVWDYTTDTDGLLIQNDGSVQIEDVEKSQEYKAFDAERQKKFEAILKQIKLENPCKGHELFQTKNLVPYGRVIKDSLVSYNNGVKDVSFKIKESVAIPFVDTCGGDIVGLQYRKRDLSKITVKYSRTKNAFHILQEGKCDKYLGHTVGYLTESFTTACEIAEAMPNAFVACTGGITQQLTVYRKIKSEREDVMLIAVLDKTKEGFPTKEEALLKAHCRWIQLDLFNAKNNGLTDYNEFALKYGKGAVKREIYQSTMKIYPKMPEVISYDDGELKIISATTGQLETVRLDTIEKSIPRVMNGETLRLFRKKSGIDEKETAYKLGEKWVGDAVSSIDRVPKGKGVFKDGEFIVANMDGARLKINGEVENVVEMMPVSEQLYLNIRGDDISKDILTKKELEDYERCFMRTYGDDSRSLFYLLLGFTIQGVLSGISPHRTHLWLTGITGSGKSKIKEYMIDVLSSRLGMATVDATAAAIDQQLVGNDGHNAVLVTVDECGDETAYKESRIKQLITLACEVAVTQGLGAKIRGTAAQEAKVYNRTAAMLFCSQTHSLSNPQDIARFFIIDVNNYDLNKKELDNLHSMSVKIADKFIMTTLKSSEKFLEIFPKIRNNFVDKLKRKVDISHKNQASAAITAGYAALLHTIGYEDYEERAYDKLMGIINMQIDKHIEQVTNEADILDEITLTPLKIDGFEHTLPEYLNGGSTDNDKTWRDYGVRLNKKKQLCISLSRFKIPQIFGHYYNKKVHISKSKLMDLSKYNKNVNMYSTKIGGKSERVIIISEVI